MRAAARHSIKTIFAFALSLALAFAWLVPAAPPAHAAAEDGDSSALTATKIRLKTYELDADGNWDTKHQSTTITENGGKLRIAVTATWSDGTTTTETRPTRWADRGGFEKGFSYKADSDSFVTVNSQGVVTGKKDGKTEITVTPNDQAYQDLSAKITITTKNQGTGLQVSKVQIVDAKGKAYGDDDLKVTDASSITKLYARVTYKDKSDGSKVVYGNYPSAPASEKPQGKAFDNLKWSVGDTNYATVNTHAEGGVEGIGYFKALANASTQVFLSLSGGDASKDNGMGYGVVVDSIGVKIKLPGKAAKVSGEDPADHLTIRVVYEKDKDTVVTEKTYSVKQFEKLGVITRTYTLTQTGGKYVTDKARGVPIATLLAHLKIDTNDIAYFTLAANDGANPGQLTAKWLLKKTRYYLPNFDLGGSWQEKKQVPTMIATADSWNQNTTITGDLNSGTRFRLVFGSMSSADNATSKSIKFINTMTVVMRGAAPSRHGKGNAANTDTTKNEQTEGHGDNSGSASGGENGGSGNNPGAATASGENTIGPKSAVQSGGFSKKSDSGVKELDDSSSWRIYQMMNKSNSELTPLGYEENPLTPFAGPAAVLVLLLAAAWRYARYRRGLRG